MNDREIIAALKAQRKELALTQRELAELIAVPQSTIYRLENHKTSPQLVTIVRYAACVGIKLQLKFDLNMSLEALKASRQSTV